MHYDIVSQWSQNETVKSNQKGGEKVCGSQFLIVAVDFLDNLDIFRLNCVQEKKRNYTKFVLFIFSPSSFNDLPFSVNVFSNFLLSISSLSR